ncbi:bifunctional 2-polyprenyl-6-hydroxyphenol methylase/3-demethylubiquinol 3-O-methyltransferase UbiG [Microlunatus sp. Gsoil 973]|uniref:class I SAM-dependent methyltransferase n=1 Tax=Microlunatus sp. Gsoil 973 TaxID=2672569 RepID=UPI0012B4C648|nr:class I SAM-dependent methyltransferase [Microlunatus sp. Gsoil 973]QGN32072.1 methyltransferase domain-containing protein [Microlunatus sp. Gsoil 973]
MSDADEVRRGAAIYSRPVLRIYDLVVVRLSNSFVWRCHRDRMVEQYERCVGRRHLDVGPGTAWYLAKASLPAGVMITLVDLNANSLARASARLAGLTTIAVQADVLAPLPDAIGRFDSVAANFVFHCLPGSWAVKGVAFGHVADRLAADGVFFGSTILGRGVRHNLVGRRLMAIYNRRGIFHNADDDQEGLERSLREHFMEVTVTVVGTVALFRARGPRR